jgi:anti-sigma factor RsiW
MSRENEGGAAMTCSEFEILFCDYVDGLLRDPEKAALEHHLGSCVACTELAQDIRGAVAFIGRSEKIEPPAELLTRILHDIPSAKAKPERKSWLRKIFGGAADTILQPRLAMGMAMTVLSLSMLATLVGFRPRPLHPSDLDPVKIWSAMDDRAHRTWARAVKYYDNMRLVIEVQSRLKEWSEQDQEQKRLQQQRQQQEQKGTAPKERQK